MTGFISILAMAANGLLAKTVFKYSEHSKVGKPEEDRVSD